jgi:UDP-N-acetylmuramoyl-L-alanyl-D-glutamate--2,6-diaminopimelate ligase
MKLLKDIIYGVRIMEIKGNTNIAIDHVSFDTRDMAGLSLFVAVKGTTVDGHKFISKAEQNGACGIICEILPEEMKTNVTYIKVSDSSDALSVVASNFYDNPSEEVKLIGITGTNGKTTSVSLLNDLFRLLGYKTGLISTVNIKINHKVFPSTHTTPDSLSINKLLREMINQGCTHVFMEVSSHALDQNRTNGLFFDVAVFTNISRDHLDYHPTYDHYIKSKKKLFDNLSDSSHAIVNFDDHHGATICLDTKAKTHSYGIKGDRDFRGKMLENDISGLTIEIDGFEMISRLIGEFNIYNLLVTYSVAKCLGEDTMTILTILSNLKAPEGRFQYFISSSKITTVIDYAHTPDALENVLKTLVSLRKGNEKIFTVFGCGGDRDKGKRPIMGSIAVNYSDHVIITSDNPRNEDPELINHEVFSGISPNEESKVLTITDRKEAIKVACTMAKSGDILLVAGKGHEKYQIMGDEKIHFDDLETTIEIFKKINK